MFIRYIPNTTKIQLFQEPNIRAIKAYSTITQFKYKKEGDIALNIPKLT